MNSNPVFHDPLDDDPCHNDPRDGRPSGKDAQADGPRGDDPHGDGPCGEDAQGDWPRGDDPLQAGPQRDPGRNCTCGGRTGSARVAPAGDGVAPTRGEVAGIDWSGGAEAAAVGRLLDTTASIDRLRVEQVEALVQVIESGAAEQVLGVAVEVVLSQPGRIAREQSRRLLRAAHTLARMPAVRHGFRQGWLSWSQVDAICWDEMGVASHATPMLVSAASTA